MLFFLLIFSITLSATVNAAFDSELYESVLDPELCDEQLSFIQWRPSLLFSFMESGLRVPRSILEGNVEDWGNYHQCLGIYREGPSAPVEGKYCSITVPVNLNIDISGQSEDIGFNANALKLDELTEARIAKAQELDDIVHYVNRNTTSRNGLEVSFRLATCVPKACTTQEFIEKFYNISLTHQNNFCRMKNDKPWVAGDYVAVVIIGIFLVLTVLSTSYDLYRTFFTNFDPKSSSRLLSSFSVWTNCRRLLSTQASPATLHCVDGIRSLAMAWVIIGHVFYLLPQRQNLLESVNWTFSMESLWIMVAPITVDTFFMLSGLLVVYTTAGKLTGPRLLKSLHLFYLSRLLRMFPTLALAVLLQASLFFRAADGPRWAAVAANTQNCRDYWWSTLLYVQNYVNPRNLCLGHTWYLAVDIQLHLLSPIFLYWVLSSKRSYSWIALAVGLLAFQIPATIYNFIMKFPGDTFTKSRLDEQRYFMDYYYFNTLTRASPFFVGMIFGYLLHIYKDRKLQLSKISTACLWAVYFVLSTLMLFSSYPPRNLDDWSFQTYDSLHNSFHRPIWAACVGWLIFACHKGYGGPINWVLSLQMWKLPSRLSYAMYIFHFPVMYVTAGTALAPVYFSVSSTLYRFCSEIVIHFIVAFIVTLIFDSPCSTLIKIVMGPGPKKPKMEEDTNKFPEQNGKTYNDFENNNNLKWRPMDRNVIENEKL